jgi:formylglycine-generating enzyme
MSIPRARDTARRASSLEIPRARDAVRRAGAFTITAGLLAAVLSGPSAEAAKAECPDGMSSVLGRYCIDRYEASLAVVDKRGRTIGRHSPFHTLNGEAVKAESRRGVYPQGYVSMKHALEACNAAGKRLCKDDEWVTACMGRDPTTYPYGNAHVEKRCNDHAVSPLRTLFGIKDEVQTFGWQRMNDPRLNQVAGSLARTGAFKKCRNAFGVHDMVGNLHEWTADPDGTFRGGFYLDNTTHGLGCRYRTTGHSSIYHDYSTGFRCCSDPDGGKKKRRSAAGSGAKSAPKDPGR